MWTQLASLILGIVGIAVLFQRVIERFTSYDVTAKALSKHAEQRFSCAKSVRLIEAPVLDRSWFSKKPALERYLLLTDADGASVLVDISWVGRLSMERSLARVTADVALGGVEIRNARNKCKLLDTVNGCTFFT